MDSELKKLAEKQAKDEGISLCEFCRRRLKENSRILKIENDVEKILYILENRDLYKSKRVKVINGLS
jgi:hypothetical protein